MKKSILCGIALVAGLWSCTEDYTNWDSPQSNTANDAEPRLEMAVQPTVSSIDFANYQEEAIQLFTTNLSKEEADEYAVAISGEDINHTPIVINANSEGRVITKEFTQVIEKLYGRAPVERSLIIQVATIATKETADGDVNVRRVANPFKMKATLDAPYIASAYYLIGGEKDWNEAEALTQPFTHSGKDVYEDPVFSFVIKAGTDRWFSFGDASQIAATTAGDWNQLYGFVGEQTDKGTFGRRADIGAENTFHVDGSAKFYRFTVNMLTMEYEITPINFDPYIYFIGATDGWANAEQRLALTDESGIYTGFLYCADPNGWGNEFKFQKVPGDWDTEINTGMMTGGITGDFADGGGNFKANAGEGVYYVTLNMANMSINAVKVEKMGIIGDFNGWGGDVEMTWNATDYCFEATNAGVTANGWKFRVNSDWGINLGANDSVEPSTVTTDLVANGKNLGVAGSTVKLYPTRKTSDNIYCTVE